MYKTENIYDLWSKIYSTYCPNQGGINIELYIFFKLYIHRNIFSGRVYL